MGDAVLLVNRSHPVAGIPLGNGSQVNPGALVQRDSSPLLQVDMLRPHAGQQQRQFSVLRHPVGVLRKAPGRGHRRQGDVKGPVCGSAEIQGPGNQVAEFLPHIHRRPPRRAVQPGHCAVLPGAGERLIQAVDLVFRRRKRRLRLPAAGPQAHHRVHGKDLYALHLLRRSAAAGGQAPRQQQ